MPSIDQTKAFFEAPPDRGDFPLAAKLDPCATAFPKSLPSIRRHFSAHADKPCPRSEPIITPSPPSGWLSCRPRTLQTLEHRFGIYRPFDQMMDAPASQILPLLGLPNPDSLAFAWQVGNRLRLDALSMQGQDVHAAWDAFDQIVDWHAPLRLADNQWGFDLVSTVGGMEAEIPANQETLGGRRLSAR